VSAAICLGTLLIDDIGNYQEFATTINPFHVLADIDQLAQQMPRSQYLGDIHAIAISVGFELSFIMFAVLWMGKRYGKPNFR
jgi:hypothetical protein